MKYLDEYRDARARAQSWRSEIRRIQTQPWVIMEVCGGQTHSIVKYGIDGLLPEANHADSRAGLSGLRHPAGNDRQGARSPPGPTSSSPRSATCCACPAHTETCSRLSRAAPIFASSIRRWIA